MTTQRRSILEGLPSLDDMASKFAPKQKPSNAPPPEKVAEVAEQVNFTSREPMPSVIVATPVTTQPIPKKRMPMVHRTGRTSQFTCKTTPEIIDEFYDYARQKGWKVGETFEKAFAALKEKDKG